MRLFLVLLAIAPPVAAGINDCPPPGPERDQWHHRLQARAETGDARAHFALGVHYYGGSCLGQDFEQSTQHFHAAAKAGHRKAAFNLGNAHLSGRGTKKNVSQAVHWWRQAAWAGLPNAAHNLGVWYLREGSTSRHQELGIAWLLMAAQANWKPARDLLTELDIDESQPLRDELREPERSEALLQTAHPEGYCLQLFSADSRQAAFAFVERYDLEASVLLFRLPQDGNLRWNLVLCGYDKARDAEQALANMREPLKAHKPWLRKAENIQNKIRRVWQEPD